MIIGLLLATPGLAAAQPGSPDLAGLVAAVANANQKLGDLGAAIQAQQEGVNKAIVDVQAGDVHLAVLAPRDWRGASGEAVGIRVNDRTACFFDDEGTTRIHRSDRGVPADQEGVAI